MNEEIIVSIWCLTYNHDKYIRDALEGFLKQKTNFKYQICIFDDASTDSTQEIINEYVKKYPELFDVCLSKTNTYGKPERRKIIQSFQKRAIKGKYVACCEGDDFWINANKLQIQVDFMDSHPECMLHSHSSKWINCETGEESNFFPYKESHFLTPEELILKPNGNISTASMLVRKEAFFMDEGFPLADVGDVRVQLHAISKGMVYYLNETMSAYRYMHAGSWSEIYNKDLNKWFNHCFNMIVFFRNYDKYVKYKYHSIIGSVIGKYLLSIAECDANNFEGCCDSFLKEKGNEFNKAIEELKRVHSIIKSDGIRFDDDSIEELEKYEHIFIFGAGFYSHCIEKMLDNSGLKWDGFVVSNRCEDNNRNNHPVLGIDQITFDVKNTMVVIGVGMMWKDEILIKLNKYGYKNYLSPLWFDEKILFES